MTPEILERLRQAFAIGCTDEEACAYAKISTSTLYEYQKDNHEFVEEKERLKKEPILKAKHTVVQSLNDVKDAQWYLERKSRDEFSPRQEVKSDSTNTNLDVDVSKVTDPEERLAEVIRKIKELKGD